MTVKFIYRPQLPALTKIRRNVFKNTQFVKWLYREHYLDDYADIFDLTEMAKGKTPLGYCIHHIRPLSGGGSNHYDNLVLIEEKCHLLLHRYYYDCYLKDADSHHTIKMIVPSFPRIVTRKEMIMIIRGRTCRRYKKVGKVTE